MGVIFLFWIYFYINNYRNTISNKKIGLKKLICSINPKGVCVDDNTSGPFNGAADIYQITKKDEDLSEPGTYPSELLSNENIGKYTYLFWFKLDYNNWLKYQSEYSITDNYHILSRSDEFNGSSSNTDINISMIDMNNIKISFLTESISRVVEVPFDKWIHLGISIDQKTANIYVNAVLVHTIILSDSIDSESKDLYIGGNNIYNEDDIEYITNGFCIKSLLHNDSLLIVIY